MAEEAKKSFERFCLVKRERRERRLKREKALDMSVMLVSFAVVFTLLFRLVTYWA
uniref:Transmembrane protein n=1 Tax=Lotus japonicus TaxID=34305 RepID=I3SEE2_LOTJA|nr:unknown [Lotus japonicus]